MINEWMKRKGLLLAEQNGDDVQITKRRKYKPPCFELKRFEIRIGIDKNWSFKVLITEVAKKADRVVKTIYYLLQQ